MLTLAAKVDRAKAVSDPNLSLKLKNALMLPSAENTAQLCLKMQENKNITRKRDPKSNMAHIICIQCIATEEYDVCEL